MLLRSIGSKENLADSIVLALAVWVGVVRMMVLCLLYMHPMLLRRILQRATIESLMLNTTSMATGCFTLYTLHSGVERSHFVYIAAAIQQ